MIVYPAIDLRRGKVVRLLYGDPDWEMRYSDDPAAVARRWADEGAQWLHVVNLDGALEEAGEDNLAALQAIVKAVDVPIQSGGGVRSLDDVQRLLDAGVSRVILGTSIVRDTGFATDALEQYGPESLAFALDARDGRVATHGWQQASDWTPIDLGRELAKLGAVHTLYTDISRDGNMSGVNVDATASLARETGLKVIASGGVSSLDDIVELHDCGTDIAGVVIGKALYLEAFPLSAAIALANGQEPGWQRQ